MWLSASADGSRLDPLAALLDRVQERLNLAQASQGEVAIVRAGEPSQEGDPLEMVDR
jgi:hypothetical protein